MTRKEYISQLLNTNIPYETTVGEYIRTLEQRIAELEAPKTCEGCKWDCPRESFIYDEYCSMCIRDNNKEDYYEPKETK